MSQQGLAKTIKFESQCLEDTAKIGSAIAKGLQFPACVYLHGDLGAGKTTLCKSIIQNLGNSSVVTSPTYNLIQEYPVQQGIVYHMDLYRLEDPEELQYLALPDLWTSESLFLIEWPEKGHPLLPAATHEIELLSGEVRTIKMSYNRR